MSAIIRWSLRFRLLVVAVAAGVLAIGVATLRDAPVDVLPEFTPPYAEIQTEALGLSATEVENLITVPLEADLLNGVQDVDVIRSQSLPGLSSIVLVFKSGTDIYQARQLVQERLAQAHALPRVSKPPTLLQPLSSSSRVLMIGVSSDEISPIERSVVARWTLKPRLMGVPGVANVAIWGMRDQQIQVQVDPDRLRDRDVTLDQVISTSGNAQIVSPLTFLEASTPGSGGFIETPQQRLQVRNVLDRLADPDELGKVPVEGTGGKLRLSDVSDIRVDHQPLIGDAVVNDGDGLMLVVEKFPGTSTTDVTKGVEDALETLKPGLAGMRVDTSVFRPASYVEEAIDNLMLALIVGFGLVALALAAFLYQWRSVLVALIAIPVALVTAALVLDAMGQTFNAISFAGLAAVLALVIDDAVTGTASVGGRMRLAREESTSQPASQLVFDATHQMRSPLGYGVLIALLAIVPVAVIGGRPGGFFEPLAIAYAFAIAAAMLVSLTLAPALSLLLHSRGTPRYRESPLLSALRPTYDRTLGGVLARPRAMAIVLLASVGVAVGGVAVLDAKPVPTFEDGNVVVRLDGEPGTSNTRMAGIAADVSRELRALPGVRNAGAHVGRAVTGDARVDVNSAEVWASISPDADHDATMRRIEDAVAGVEAVEHQVASYTTDRIRAVGALNQGSNDVRGDGLDLLTGADTPLVTRVYGHDPDQLPREAERVRGMMQEVDGVTDARIEEPVTQPNLVIEVDLAKAQRLGIKPGDVRRSEAALLQGIQVGSVFDDQKVFDVLVVGAPATRESIDGVRNLLIDRPGGGHVRLGDVADVRIEPTPVAIDREAISRYLDVTAGVSGRGVSAVADDIRERLAAATFPLEYHAEVLELTTNDEIGLLTVLAFGLVAAIAAFLLLQAAFRSWRLAGAASLVLLAALVGGLIAALIGGGDLELGAMLGLLTVFGLGARTAVLTLKRLQDLPGGSNGAPAAATVRSSAGERLGPVLTTTVAVAALSLPIVVLGTRPGLEIVQPMAVVLLGGVLTTALATLYGLPAVYLRYGEGAAPAVEWREVRVTQFEGIEHDAEPGRLVTPAGVGHNGEVAPPGAGHNGETPPPGSPAGGGTASEPRG